MNKDLEDYDIRNNSYVGYDYVQGAQASDDEDDQEEELERRKKKKKNK